MLFLTKLVSKQPHDMTNESWQALVTEQLRAVKQQLNEGRIVGIYREVGEGVIAIYNVDSPQDLDRVLQTLPLFKYFAEVEVRALWDMREMIQSIP